MGADQGGEAQARPERLSDKPYIGHRVLQVFDKSIAIATVKEALGALGYGL